MLLTNEYAHIVECEDQTVGSVSVLSVSNERLRQITQPVAEPRDSEMTTLESQNVVAIDDTAQLCPSTESLQYVITT